MDEEKIDKKVIEIAESVSDAEIDKILVKSFAISFLIVCYFMFYAVRIPFWVMFLLSLFSLTLIIFSAFIIYDAFMGE
jgi:integral membrane sensor domain MASE1